MPEQDPHKLVNQLEQEADDLGRESQELKREVEETREDWQRKRADESIPGAPPPAGRDEGPEDAPADV